MHRFYTANMIQIPQIPVDQGCICPKRSRSRKWDLICPRCAVLALPLFLAGAYRQCRERPLVCTAAGYRIVPAGTWYKNGKCSETTQFQLLGQAGLTGCRSRRYVQNGADREH